MKTVLHFVHGNGFPGGSYRQLLTPLEEQFAVVTMDTVGHTKHYPVTDNWHFLVDEVIAHIRQSSDSPVVAVGHSLGGILSLLASVKEPSLFQCVVMLDSPILSRTKSVGVYLAKKLGFINQLTPAAKTKNRQVSWNSLAEFESYLKSRALFAAFSAECLQDYMQSAVVEVDGEWRLRYQREIEYQIYRTLPHSLPKIKGHVTTPLALIYGTHSNVIGMHDRRYAKRHFSLIVKSCKGGHLFPLEEPGKASKALQYVLNQLLAD